MSKRELFVFAGQSNMMGACVYPAKEQIVFASSYEYLHKPKRLGCTMGDFKSTGFPCGEFSYIDLQKAYGDRRDPSVKSELNNYRENTYFCTSMCNLKSETDHSTNPFDTYSEKTVGFGTALPPFIVQGWERMGRKCAYAHIAKGAVSILHYFDEDMLKELNALLDGDMQPATRLAGAYFREKVTDFFADCEKKFQGEEHSTRVCFWLQGESDPSLPQNVYQACLRILWKRLKALGFTHFFLIRVGYWTTPEIINVIRAQEAFCRETAEAYMLTRACSLMPLAGQDETAWFIRLPEEKYHGCRDSFFGFENQHINEKGFRVIAEGALSNMKRILTDGQEPIPEEENLKLI